GRDGEAGRRDGARRGLESDRVVVAAVAVVEAVAGDGERAAAGAEHVLRLERLRQARRAVAADQAQHRRARGRCGGAVIDLAVGRGRDGEAGRRDGARRGLESDRVVVAAVAVVEAVAGDGERAAAGAEHVLRLERLRQARRAVAADQAQHRRARGRCGGAVIDLAVGRGRDGEAGRRDGARRGLESDRVVVAAVAVVEAVAGDGERAAAGAEHVLRLERLRQARRAVAADQAQHRRARGRCGGAVIDLAVGRGRDGEAGRRDGARRGLESDRVVVAAVAVVEAVAGDGERAAAGAEHVLRLERLRQARRAVAADQAQHRRARGRCGGAVIDLAVGRGRDGEAGRRDGARRGLESDRVVVAAVAVVEAVAGDGERAAGGAEHVLRLERLRQARRAVAADQAQHRRARGRGGRAVIDLAVGRGRDGEAGRRDGARRGLESDRVVVAAVAVVEAVAGDGERAAGGAEHVLRLERLRQARRAVAADQAQHRRARGRGGRAVIDLAVGRGRDGEAGRRDGARRGLERGRVVVAAVAVVEAVAGDGERAAAGAEHVLRLERLRQARRAVAADQAQHRRRGGRGGRAVIDFAVGRGRDGEAGRRDGDGAAVRGDAGEGVVARRAA